MKKHLVGLIIGLIGIIHTHQYYSPEFNKYKPGQCVANSDDRFYIDKYDSDVYTVIYLDGLLNLVKAKIEIDRRLVDLSFLEITCP